MPMRRSSTTSDDAAIHGFADPRFHRVVDAFADNFRERDDLGAACCVYLDGRPVVDIWAGVADCETGRPWERDTAAVIFSCTKGVLAIAMYLLVQDGRLDLDAPVADYWPAFAGHGKAHLCLRDVLTHRAGLPALDVGLTLAEVVAWEPVIAAIEAQPPHFAPEDGHFYHAMTYGWLVGEVIRRVTGQTPGTFLQDRIAGRLGLDLWIGLPTDLRGRVARMEAPLPDAVELQGADATARAARLVEPSLTMGAYPFPVDGAYVTFNDPVIQAAEIPGANGISTARSLARLYAACVSGVDGGQPWLSETSLDDAMVLRSAGRQLSGLPDDGARWGTGFQLASPPHTPMLGPASLGHAGAGGQLGFGDRALRVGFGWLSNQMGGYGDARARMVTEALDAVLHG